MIARERLELMKAGFLSLAVAAVVALAASSASAGTITDTGNISVSGTGFGTVTTLLTLQASGGTETGSVSRVASADVKAGDTTAAPGQNQTVLVSSITSDLDRLVLIFNVNDSGNDAVEFATLNSLVANFYTNVGGAPIASAIFAPVPKNFPQFGGGIGGSGSVLQITLTAAEKLLVGAAGVRIGLAASVSNIDNGPDTFFVAEGPAPVVPVPAAAWTGLSVLAGLGIFGKLRKRLVVDNS